MVRGLDIKNYHHMDVIPKARNRTKRRQETFQAFKRLSTQDFFQKISIKNPVSENFKGLGVKII